MTDTEIRNPRGIIRVLLDGGGCVRLHEALESNGATRIKKGLNGTKVAR
jgi:hypothetical protein